MLDFGVLNPSLLVLTPAVVIIFGALLVLRDKERLRRTVIVGARPIETPRWRVGSLIVATMLALIGISRPYYGMNEIEVPSLSSDRIFLIDVSRSMLTKDVLPSRMELAKRKLRDYLEELSRAGLQERIGVVLFAGSSYLYCPLTEDQMVLAQFVENISPNLVTALGSNLESGIRTAAAAFDRSRSKNPSILLVSDGEDRKLRQEDSLIKILTSRHITVDVLALGTEQGKPIELEDGRFLRDGKGEIVVSRLNDQFLKRVAAETRGAYVVAGLQNIDVEAIIARVQRSHSEATGDGTPKMSKITTYGEFGFLLLIPACVLFALAIAPRGAGVLLRCGAPFIFLVFAAHSALAQDPASPGGIPLSARDGFQAYEKGEFEKAKVALENAHQKNPADQSIAQALASTYYQLGQYSAAEALFQTLRENAATGKVRYENAFNLGNSRYMQSNFEGAIAAYESALRVKPDDVPATNNLALAKKRLREEKKKPTPSPTPSTQPSPNQSPNPSPSPGTATPTPSGSPSANASAAASPSGTQTPSESPTGGSGTSTPNPDSNESSGTPNATVTAPPSPSSDSEDQATPSPSSPAGTPNANKAPTPSAKPVPTPEERSMSEQEADRWLDSLPDSPLLLRRNTESTHSDGQTW